MLSLVTESKGIGFQPRCLGGDFKEALFGIVLMDKCIQCMTINDEHAGFNIRVGSIGLYMSIERNSCLHGVVILRSKHQKCFCSSKVQLQFCTGFFGDDAFTLDTPFA